ncbi:MAG TPA: AAA family ATPase [Gaiellaceae bacterium]|nr:AAA family ATPase [Gaiellaceae bacterium]
MAAATESIELVGREAQLGRVDAWIQRLDGTPAALLVAGEAGIGKTAVWAAAVSAARTTGALVLSTRPVEAELPLGYAGLGDLLGELAPTIVGELPEPLARALEAALFLRDDEAGADPSAVARGTLWALRALAARSVVVLAIDDVQWLDPASARALAFSLRRLGSAPVAVAASLRDGHLDPLELATAFEDGLEHIRLEGLTTGALGRLLRLRIDRQLPRRTVVRIAERSAGNPFFALQLAHEPDESRLPATLRDVVDRRLATLPRAAEGATFEAAVMGPARPDAFADGVGLEAALASGVLVEREGRVGFTHPLLAAGAYQRVPAARRRALHRQAAERTAGLEERARHLALATESADPAVAALLDEAAHAADFRGASEFAVELAAHARRLTSPADLEAYVTRTLNEAEFLYRAADEPAARERIDVVLASGVRGVLRARALIHRALHASEPEEAVALCEEAIAERHDDERLAARALSTLAWQRGAWLGDVEAALPEALAAVELAERLDDESTLATVLTGAALICAIAADPRSEELFRRAIEIADRTRGAPGDREPRSAFAHQLWWRGDFAAGQELLDGELERSRRHGDDGALMRLAVFRAELELRRGRWDEVERLVEEALEDARDYWRIAALQVRCLARGRRGDPAALGDAIEISASPFAASDPVIAATAAYATGLVQLAAGDVGGAADQLLCLADLTERLGAYTDVVLAAIPDATLTLLEADRAEDAERLTVRLETRAAKGDHPWAAAAAALCRGSVLAAAADLDAALAPLADSRRAFESMGARWELARSLLAEGRTLRRAGARNEAAALLEQAAAVFGELGADPWRKRALDELKRARPRPRRDDSLTAAESRVASLVAAGRTNREVASELFTTVATVEAHLTRIYRKLGLRSRTELARAVADGDVELDG